MSQSNRQKGIAHILIILILLIGLALGLYLIKNPQILRSRASVSSPSSPVLLPIPIGYWKFDEGTGTIANNAGLRSLALNGTLGGAAAPTWTVTSKSGKALNFNGSSSSVSITDNYNPTAYTISAWVRPTTTTSSASVFVKTDRNGPTASWSDQIRINSRGQFESYLWDGHQRVAASSTVVSANTWYYVAATVENGGLMHLYVNGVEDASPVSVGNIWTGGTAELIGSNSGDHMGFFGGQIDEVKLYDTALTADQILSDMDPSQIIVPTPTVSPLSTPTPILSVAPTGDLEKRVNELETQLVQTQQQQSLLKVSIDKIITWIKSIFPGFN